MVWLAGTCDVAYMYRVSVRFGSRDIALASGRVGQRVVASVTISEYTRWASNDSVVLVVLAALAAVLLVAVLMVAVLLLVVLLVLLVVLVVVLLVLATGRS